ncbi:MAG TPA: radical SAM protein [bacterium]|nr:radical SAM protein [bacterium]
MLKIIDKIKKVCRNPDYMRMKIRKHLAIRAAGRVLPRRMIPAPAMVSVVPTLQCNLRCRTCGLHANLSLPDRQPVGTDFRRVMTRVQLMDVADQIHRMRSGIQISGGEPTLHPDLIPFIRRAAGDYRLVCDMMTNGLLLGDLATDLLSSNLASMHVSMDGTGGAYDAVRGDGMFRQFDRSLTGFFREKSRQHADRMKTVAVFTAVPENQADLPDSVRYAMEIGFDQFLLLHPVRIDMTHLQANNRVLKDSKDHALWTWGEQLDLTRMDVPALKDAIRKSRDIIAGYPGRSWRSNPELDIYGFENYYAQQPVPLELQHPCPAFHLHCVIYPDGSVMPSNGCYFQSLGNVFETPLKEIWYGPAYHALRQRVRSNGTIPLCTFCFIAYNGCI